MPIESTEERKLAAIMFTDMVGYSALAQRDDKVALELLEEHRRLLREIFPRFHGTEIKTIGDAFLVEFGSALEAAQCAIEIQRTLAKRNHDVTADRRIEIKIGIHIGDVVHRGGDVYGDGVNIASRIEPLAGAGGICVSTDVERQIRNALEARLEKLGPTELKNIQAPMDLFRIVLPWDKPLAAAQRRSTLTVGRSAAFLAGIIALSILILELGAWRFSRRGNGVKTGSSSVSPGSFTQTSIHSIAVKPLDNYSGEAGQDYFADGLTDVLTTYLANIGALEVRSRSSVMQYKGSKKTILEIGRELNVDAVLEGSVQRAGNQVTITAQLIEATTDRHLWSTNYERAITNILRLQGEVARDIAAAIRITLTPQEKARFAVARPVDSTAFDLYLQAKQHWYRFTDRKSV